MEDNLKRLNKFIEKRDIALDEKLIKSLKKVGYHQWCCPELGTKVSPHDEVRIDGKLIREKRAIYLFSFQ
jgi:23S rRNA pseudouridine2604 synthase